MKINDANVAALQLPSGKNDLLVFDDALPGFGVRLRAGGKRSWVVQYRVGAQQRRLSLGSISSIDAAEARKRAKSALAQVALGQDPQAAKAAARIPETKEMTLVELVERYLPVAKRKLKPGSYDNVVIHLQKHWKPLHKMGVVDLQRRHVADQLGRLAASSGLYSANRSRAALSKLFSWAIGEGLAESNVVVGTNKAIDEVARERVLTDDEVRAAWQCSGPGDYGQIIRLLILTGQRRGEVGGILWSELHLEQALWTIGGDRTKNHLPHDIPLGESVLEIITAMPRNPKRDFVYGSGNGSFQGWSKAKLELNVRIAEAVGAPNTPWRLHDIRRTVATRMGDLGVLPHVVEAVLNHVSGTKAGVAGTYNRALYAAEKREALNRWATRVGEIVSNCSAASAAGESRG